MPPTEPRAAATGTVGAAPEDGPAIELRDLGRAYGERVGFRAADPARAASHNTPVTVAAETGLPGFLLFGWLVATALWLPFGRVSRSFAGRASLCFGLALVTILVHSLFYSGFFEDPLMWGTLAAAAATLLAPLGVGAPSPAAAGPTGLGRPAVAGQQSKEVP